MQAIPNRPSPALQIAAAAYALIAFVASAQADIFQWEYVNPADPSQGKRQSTTLAPEGAGLDPRPGVDLSYRNLSMAHLRGADLTNAHGSSVNLMFADLSEANLSGAYFWELRLIDASMIRANLADGVFRGTRMTGVDLTDAEIRGASFDREIGYDNGRFFFYGTGITPAQLHSSASYKSHDLTRISLRLNDLSGGNFSGQNLTGASLAQATLTDANFTNAVVGGAGFGRSVNYEGTGVTFGTGLTLSQLYSTASYQAHELSSIRLDGNSLAGGNFARQDLTAASLYGAVLTAADFREANLANAFLSGAVLTGANLRKANLTNANFAGATSTDADFTEADVRGANFSGLGITLAQLYSTSSYQAEDLRRINFSGNELGGGNFAGQDLADSKFGQANLRSATFRDANLTNADFGYITGYYPEVFPLGGRFPIYAATSLANTDLTGADARGARFFDPSGATVNNLIHPDGHIDRLAIETGGLRIIRDHDDDPGDFFTGPGLATPITVDEHLRMAPGGTLRMVFEADAWDSTISFAPGIPVTLSGTLELTFADDVNPAGQLGRTFHLFDWTSVTPTGAFAVSSPLRWDLSHLYTTGEITLTAVPEPASFALAVALGIGVVWCGCQRNSPRTPHLRRRAWCMD